MKKISLICLLIFAISSFILVTAAQSQPRGQRGGGYGMGPGMMWGYGAPGWGMGPGMMGGYGGYGYGMGPGMMGGWVIIPPKLPTPKNAEWVQKLKDIFASEKESLAQYETDQEKYNAYMPYMMVIPQEESHIYWIEQMFAAYEIKTDVKTPKIIKSKSLEDAYEIGVKLETDLLPRYEWLIKNAEDRDTRQALNTILLQSRMHLVMFDHSMRIGHGYGYGMRYGGMGGATAWVQA